ncbi:MAG: FAD-binding oxidoreductase [Candidatus Azambacteria bacterium]|nr:FAD-binding oxidoreductase [Candidatus Azambacteria bacterium]
MNLKEEIKKFFRGDVLDDEKTLLKYSRDAGFFFVKPKLVVFPKDSEDIQKLVAFVAAAKADNPELSLTARSAGTDMSGGPINESIIVEFNKYFNKVSAVGDNYAISEPGVYYRDFEKETLKKGLIFPSFPASRELCAIGGMVANNAGGEKSLTYGETKDYVLELKVILRDGKEHIFKKITENELKNKMIEPTLEGEIYQKVFDILDHNFDAIKNATPKVSKNSAGYNIFEVWDKNNFDMTKIFTGSQGTLGMVTSAKLGLVPVKKYSKLLVIFMNDLNLLPQIVNTVLEFQPESFETYDDHTFKVAIKFFPQILKRMKGTIFSLGIKFLPEIWMSLTGGIPKLILLPEFAGNDQNEIDQRLNAVYDKLKPLGLKMRITKSKKEAEKYQAIRRESFALLREKIKNKQTAPFIDDLIVLPKDLPAFFPELYRILDKYPSLIFTIVGHVGDGKLHIIPLMDLDDPEQIKIIPKLMDEVFDLVFKYKGSITAEHNDGLIRGPYLKKMFGAEIYAIFEEIKNIFDPQNIFNPGKKVHTSLDYALKHIKGK